jgi:hypothetical protein
MKAAVALIVLLEAALGACARVADEDARPHGRASTRRSSRCPRIPSSLPVRWLAKAGHHRGTSLLATPSPHCPRFPSPSRTPLTLTTPRPPANTTHTRPPSKHANAAASPTPIRVPTPSCAPPSLASLLPHPHLTPRPLPEPRSPSSAASYIHPRPLRYLRVFVIQLAVLEVRAGQGGCVLAPS